MTEIFRTPRLLPHMADSTPRVKLENTSAADPELDAKDPLAEERPPPPGMAKPSWPLASVTTCERELSSVVLLKAAF